MKPAILYLMLLTLTLSCNSRHTEEHKYTATENTLSKKRFETKELFGTSSDPGNYVLIPHADSVGMWVGNIIDFVDKEHFVSNYVAWCGNDCFTSVFGRYYFEDSSKVVFFTDSIKFSGECRDRPKQTKTGPPVVFYLGDAPSDTLKLNRNRNKTEPGS
ncbi:hypothetical protein DBR43_20840 [Pedobacter sp. KBW06]|uniref:hypothetical protein n=1 Tax=Pedobacter sp. KBW06 TaxID=2153359 RepID=UPI000F5A159B|nr:hypothetical protein [Pedobacter sp. KBW06]RQO70465.1 hypothetical protein DBR43_20840 [Pedobacter sp. KBW06]